MAQPLTAGLPPGLTLSGAWIVRLTATDGTSGAAVSGVTVSNVVITAVDLSASADGGTLAGIESAVLLPIAQGETASAGV